MLKFSFLKSLKENSNYKKIIVSFEPILDGYEVIENKGTFELIGMNTETCKLKNFEREVKKFIRREIYHQNPEINALTDLSLDFRLNHVYISGKKSIVKRIEAQPKIHNINTESTQSTVNTINTKNNNSEEITKEDRKSKSNNNTNKRNSNNKAQNKRNLNNNNNKTKNRKKTSKKKKNKKKRR